MSKKPTTKAPRKKQKANNPVSSPGTGGAGDSSALSPSHEQVARRAHEIWMEGGCQPNCEHANWLEAEKQLRAEGGPKPNEEEPAR